LIAAWVLGFAAQAVVRSLIFGTPTTPALLPVTGVAFILFTFYMITDPATTPNGKLAQVFFGLSIALAYALLMTFHIVFGFFFGLTIVCALRGLALHAQVWARAGEVSVRGEVAAEKA
jgi:hypothetical protein